MALKVTYGDLRNRNFLRVIGRLGSYPFKNQKLSFNIMRICKKIEAEIKLADEHFQKALKEYALLDEKGGFVPDKTPDGKDQPDTFRIPPEKQEAWQKTYDDFCALVVTIEQDPISVDKLEDLKIAPAELGLIEALIEAPLETLAVADDPSAPIPIRK